MVGQLQVQGYRNQIQRKGLPQPTVNQSAGTGQLPPVPPPRISLNDY